MKREYSLAHLTALRCPPPELVYTANLAGYDYVSPRIVNLGVKGESNYDLASQPEMLRDTMHAMEDTGIRVHDIELLRILEDTDIKRYTAAIEVGARLGARHVLSSIWTSNKEIYIEKFAQLCDLAKSYGMGVQLEFVTWADVANLAQAKEILTTINRDNAGIMLDTLHAYRSHVAPEALDHCPKSWFKFCHICDGPADIPTDKEELLVVGRDGRHYVGEGAINIADYVRRLPDDVVCSIELPHLKRIGILGAVEHARRCIESAKAYFVSHNM
ncbi:MAG: sugar phosphate isomerase/epimerase family protein [Candidatus Fimivivens sp.]